VDITHVASLSAVATGAAWVHATVVRYSDTSNYYRLHTEFGTGGLVSVKIAKHVAGCPTDMVATPPPASVLGRHPDPYPGPGDRADLQIRCWLDGGTEPDTWHAQADDTDLTGTVPACYEWRVVGNTNVGTLTLHHRRLPGRRHPGDHPRAGVAGALGQVRQRRHRADRRRRHPAPAQPGGSRRCDRRSTGS
jgi:hypothetical protein